jgi:hypothetical protein
MPQDFKDIKIQKYWSDLNHLHNETFFPSDALDLLFELRVFRTSNSYRFECFNALILDVTVWVSSLFSNFRNCWSCELSEPIDE